MPRILYIIIGLLLLPALLINLGEVVFIDDEGIRSLVAQEMMWRGEYLVPTLHGDVYLNKPPLYNWILIVNFWLWGEVSEWTARFPTVVALIGFAITAYYWSKDVLGKRLAFVHALTVVTCGRMLFWDSMLGLIDVTFSWVIFAQINWLCYFVSQKKWWKAFLPAYLLCAVGFMMKGLPAIAFTGFTIISLLLWHRSFKKLFSLAHIVSGLICLLLLAFYYVPLSGELDISLVFERIFVESGKRTAVNYAWTDTLAHLLAFPFEMFYHFLPWTLLVIFMFRRDMIAQLRKQPMVGGWAIAFLANLPLYWLSPNVYPRYLLMLFPLLFGIGLYFYQLSVQDRKKMVRWFHYGISSLILLAGLVIPFAPLHPDTAIVEYRWFWSIGCFLVFLLIIWLGKEDSKHFDWRSSKAGLLQQSLPSFVAVLLLLRIVFNVFILPPRAVSDVRGARLKTEANAIGEKYKASGEKLAVFGYTGMEPATSFYLQKAYGKIIPRHFKGIKSDVHYILNQDQYLKATGTTKDVLYQRHRQGNSLILLIDQPFPSTDYSPEGIGDGMGTGLPRVQ